MPKRISCDASRTAKFTVESLSPHRSLAFATPDDATPLDQPAAEREADLDPSAASFEQTIIANLAKAGVQNGKRKERLEFEAIENYAGQFIQAVGIAKDPEPGAPLLVGISIGPKYGTVGPPFIEP